MKKFFFSQTVYHSNKCLVLMESKPQTEVGQYKNKEESWEK